MIGKTLAHYEILESLGQGGMGDVYLARDTRLNRNVALKTVRTGDSASLARLARLRREARAAAALNHPGVVTVHSVEEADGILFITMEHVQGRTLQHALEPGGMSASTFREMAGQIAGAVAAAHEAGVVHRDLKPGNVMLDERDRIKVLDFGLARVDLPERQDDDPTLSIQARTVPGALMGTMPYMSPEQVRGDPADHRSDVFSLGSVFYEMATGARPFTADSTAELASAILRDTPRPIDEVRPGFPAEYVDLIARCLKKDPAARFAEAGELAAALEQEPRAVAVTEAPSSGASGVPALGVLDFENIAGVTDAEWLATGIAETVSVDLNRLPDLRVVARDQVVAAWAGQEGNDEAAALALGRRMGLDFVITGAFQKIGERIRITGQLLDVDGGAVAGTVKLDGEMAEIFELQDRIVADMLAGARLPVASGGLGAVRPRATGQLAAYEMFSRAKGLLLRMGMAAFDEAEVLLGQALELDPEYALAHAAFGQMRAMRYISTTDRRDLDEAVDHLETASRIDPQLDEPRVWLTYCLGRLGRYEEAIANGKKAIALNASNPQANYLTGVSYWMRAASNYQPGDWDEAIRHLSRSIKLQPTYQVGFMARFDNLYRVGRLEEARGDALAAIDVEVSGGGEVAIFIGAETQLGWLEMREGNLEEADRRFRNSWRRLDGNPHVYAPVFQVMNLCGQAEVAAAEGRPEAALSLLESGRNRAQSHPRSLGMGRLLIRVGYLRAVLLAAAGRHEEAEQALAETDRSFAARARHDFSAVWMNLDADLYVECARAREALGLTEQAAEAWTAAERNGWPGPQPS